MQNGIATLPTGRVFHSAITTPLGMITWAGRHLDNRPAQKPMAMRRWDTFSAVYVLKGHARFHDEAGLNMPVGPGDLMLMFPGHGYRYSCDKSDLWSEFFIQFRGPLFELWQQEGLLNPKQPLHHFEPIELWWQRLEAIIKPLALPEPAQTLKRICLLQEFLVDAVISPQTQTTLADTQWLAAAQAALGRNFSEPVDWNAVAKPFSLSYQRFRKKFVALGGVAPGIYRAGQVIKHSENLLHDRQLTLHDIARQCGFYDQFHFSRRFKSLTGLTPAQFRRRLI